jgi:hypothetical protein
VNIFAELFSAVILVHGTSMKRTLIKSSTGQMLKRMKDVLQQGHRDHILLLYLGTEFLVGNVMKAFMKTTGFLVKVLEVVAEIGRITVELVGDPDADIGTLCQVFRE